MHDIGEHHCCSILQSTSNIKLNCGHFEKPLLIHTGLQSTADETIFLKTETFSCTSKSNHILCLHLCVLCVVYFRFQAFCLLSRLKRPTAHLTRKKKGSLNSCLSVKEVCRTESLVEDVVLNILMRREQLMLF